MDNIPVVVSNSCLKRKKKKNKNQELISDADKHGLPRLAGKPIENQPEANPNEDGFQKECPLRSRWDAGCSRCVEHTYTHTLLH